jgi:hypothetical protein
MEDRACDWVEGARRYYESSGNPAVIREIWPVIVRQMNYFLERRSPRGLVLAREWIVWGAPRDLATGITGFSLGESVPCSCEVPRFARDDRIVSAARENFSQGLRDQLIAFARPPNHDAATRHSSFARNNRTARPR